MDAEKSLPIEEFEFKVQDRQLDDRSPYEASVLLNLWPKDGSGGPKLLMISLWLPNSNSKEDFDRRVKVADQIAELLRQHVTGVSFQTFER